jgi:hypothetical protein
MKLIKEEKRFGFTHYKLSPQSQKVFKSLFDPLKWINTPNLPFKSVPISTFKASVLDYSLDIDTIQDKTLDKKFKLWADKFVKENIHTLISASEFKISGVTAWNGSAGHDWHNDNDGRDFYKDDLTILIYHIPISLSKEDGGAICFKDTITNNELCFIPEDLDVLVIKLDKESMKHKATPIKSSTKDRFTLSIGVQIL